MPADDLHRLQAAVLADPRLQQRLLAVPDRRQFLTALVQLAGEQGLEVAAEEVESAIAERRRAWYSTWI